MAASLPIVRQASSFSVADALTGLPTLQLPMHVGPGALVWTLRGPVARLASLVSAENQFGAEPGVFLYDDGTFVEGLDAAPKAPRWDDGDFQAWAWSKDGTHGALLNADGSIEHWDLRDAKGIKLATWPTFDDARGVLYGDGVIIVVSRSRLQFIRAEDGRCWRSRQPIEPTGTRPLELNGRDLGSEMRPDPTFPLDDASWAVAFTTGTVIADPARRSDLDRKLAWVLDRRVAWPTAWVSSRSATPASRQRARAYRGASTCPRLPKRNRRRPGTSRF